MVGVEDVMEDVQYFLLAMCKAWRNRRQTTSLTSMRRIESTLS